MTVKELIKILEAMPQDVDVLRLNTEEADNSEHYEDINHVEYDEGEVLLE